MGRKSEAQTENPGDAGACAQENHQVVKRAEAKILSELIASREEELECPVCTEVDSPPLFCCEDQHLICSQCRPKVSSCPQCRRPYPFQPQRHHFAERAVEELGRLVAKRDKILNS